MNQETRRLRKWRAAEARVGAALDALEEQRPWLPMEHWAETTKLERDEWIEYYERRKRHLAQHPAYDNDWSRPTAETAEQVWQLVKPPVLLEELFPGLWLPPGYAAEVARTIKQALVVVLDSFVRAGRERRTVTVNQVFDELAGRWSDWFRQVRQQSRADRVRDMRLETATACRRDLLLNGVRLDLLWRVASGDWSKKAGQNQLYYVTRTVGRGRNPKRKTVERGGYRVRLRSGKALRTFRNLIRNDPAYRPRERTRRLLLADETRRPIELRTQRQDICGERPYNVVNLGQRSERLLEAMERSQLLFETSAFKQDYERYVRIVRKVRAWRAHALKERCRIFEDRHQAYEDLRRTFGHRVGIYTRARRSIEAYSRVYEQVCALGPETRYRYAPAHSFLLVKSGFFRAKNRRFHAAHFWPEHVRGSLDQVDRTNYPYIETRTSQRQRWFSFAAPDHDPLEPQEGLRGFDVSASQTQYSPSYWASKTSKRSRARTQTSHSRPTSPNRRGVRTAKGNSR